MKRFTAKCNKCGSTDVSFEADHELYVYAFCNNPECDQEEEEVE